MWCWGSNKYGVSGNGYTSGFQVIPRQIKSMDEIVSIASGGNHNLALKSSVFHDSIIILDQRMDQFGVGDTMDTAN